MLNLWFTREEAEALAHVCPLPALKARIEKALRFDAICPGHDARPSTVILEDHGDGLHVVAVACFTPEDAEKLADRWWAQVVEDNERAASDLPLL